MYIELNVDEYEDITGFIPEYYTLSSGIQVATVEPPKDFPYSPGDIVEVSYCTRYRTYLGYTKTQSLLMKDPQDNMIRKLFLDESDKIVGLWKASI